MYNPFSLSGKTILVTGASSGIGRAVAVECSRMGAQVILTARHPDRLSETLASMTGEGHKVVTADLNEAEAVDSLMSELPLLNGVVHCAGINNLLPVKMIRPKAFEELMQVNLFAPVYMMQKILSGKKIEKGGSVIFISSVGRKNVANGSGMYAASKGALTSFARVLALELSPRNIRVNCIEPGVVETAIFDRGTVSEEQLEQDRKTYPLGRFGRPDEIAWAAVYLLSDAAGWTTGSNVLIDGGLTLK